MIKEKEVEGFKRCCAEHIQGIWKIAGGSESVIHHETTCPKCGHYIGLTYTKEEDAIAILKEFNLEYL